MIETARILRFELVAANPVALAAFYVGALGFERACDDAERIDLRLGQEAIRLARPDAPGRPAPSDLPGWSPWFQHFAIVTRDMESAMARLRTREDWTPISEGGPQRLPASSGGVTAFKFRDPEGHPLELLAFPPDKAPARWSRNAGDPCLGLDHSALSVRDASASVAFYESLGFRESRRSLNRGAEQARLDGLPDPVVEITGLSLGAAAPGLELLCYRGDFARTKERLRMNDALATRVVLEVPHGEPQLLQDPDGHWIAIETGASSSLPPSA